MKALIGYTGFVGGTIANQTTFDELYNSKNIHEMQNKEYDLVVCAGAPGKKWLANQKPHDDKQSIDSLISVLKSVTAKRFVLISSVDVYNKPSNVDEDTVIEEDTLSPYGLHRRMLETFVSRTFDASTIIRLPALFGTGLKKNFIFDLINDHMVNYTHPESSFQFYNMKNLWKDILTVTSKDIDVINFAVEPVRAGTIEQLLFNKEVTPDPAAVKMNYDVHTKYASLFNGSGFYIKSAEAIKVELVTFIKEQQKLITL